MTKMSQSERRRAERRQRQREIRGRESESLCLSVETNNFRRDSHQAILAITYSSTKK